MTGGEQHERFGLILCQIHRQQRNLLVSYASTCYMSSKKSTKKDTFQPPMFGQENPFGSQTN